MEIMTAMPDVISNPETVKAQDKAWRLIVWNDPVNLMSYVSYVFRSYFGFSRAKAERLRDRDGFKRNVRSSMAGGSVKGISYDRVMK